MDLIHELRKTNQGLADRGIRLRIEQRGSRLNLRGPLPCKSKESLIRTQRLNLGLTANQDGLEEAQKVLELVLLELHRKKFDWSNWSKKTLQNSPKRNLTSIEDQIKKFEIVFFDDPYRRKSIPGCLSTWKSSYLPYLRRLLKLAGKSQSQINVNLLTKTLLSYQEQSRSRLQCATSLGAFARHLNLTLPENWYAEAAGYGMHKARFRRLPNDELIIKSFYQIPNPKWRLVYGLMATYGLRNHEVFFCDLSTLNHGSDKVLRVLPLTKTGEHQTWPFHPLWFQKFQLEELGKGYNALPRVNIDLKTTTLQQVGRRVAEQFKRYKLPLTPYDLRHAWAIRTIHIGLPDTVAARMMGHSVTIHTKTYHHWITRRDQQKAVDDALARQFNES